MTDAHFSFTFVFKQALSLSDRLAEGTLTGRIHGSCQSEGLANLKNFNPMFFKIIVLLSAFGS